MGSRLNLSNLLHEIVGNDNVYFQPPPSKILNYPCIVYERARLNTEYANNKPYKIDKVYYVTYVYTNPDDDIPLKIANLPMCAHQRHYVQDNKYYDQFRLVY